jgi:hypothetical protein
MNLAKHFNMKHQTIICESCSIGGRLVLLDNPVMIATAWGRLGCMEIMINLN